MNGGSGADLFVFERYPRPMLLIGADARVATFNRAAGAAVPNLREGQSVMAALGSYALADAYEEARKAGRAVERRVRLYLPDRREMRARLEPHGPEVFLFLEDESDAIDYQELRSQFASIASHELRTPVAAIQSLAEAIADADDDPQARAGFVARLGHEAERLVRLVDEILFLSRLEGGQELPGEGCDVADAVAEGMAGLAGGAAAGAQRVTVEVEPALRVRGSQRLVATAVRNLVENAVTHGGPGVSVAVRARRGADPARADAVIEVADDGPGIARAHLPHLFERFYRVDPSRSRGVGGTGLGLAIVKHIATGYGGAATAESVEGFGSTFRVTLPLDDAA